MHITRNFSGMPRLVFYINSILSAGSDYGSNANSISHLSEQGFSCLPENSLKFSLSYYYYVSHTVRDLEINKM